MRFSNDEISMETQLQIDYDFVYINFNQFIDESNVTLFLFLGKQQFSYVYGKRYSLKIQWNFFMH